MTVCAMVAVRLDLDEARDAAVMVMCPEYLPVRTLMQQQLLRRFAEEARDQGLPYPKHWFDADGSWLGIGFNQFRDQLPGKTRRALNYATAEADAVQDVLGVRPDPSDAMGEDRGYDRASPSDSSRRRL